MRQRLTLALVGIALASIVFVGLGVLSLAQIGAREDAVAQMSEGLTAIGEIDFTNNRGPNDLGRLRNALKFDELEFVAVAPSGELIVPRQRREGTSPRSDLNDQVKLSNDQVAQLKDGEQVFVDLRGKVIGIQAINLNFAREDVTPALIAQSSVATIGSGARRNLERSLKMWMLPLDSASVTGFAE